MVLDQWGSDFLHPNEAKAFSTEDGQVSTCDFPKEAKLPPGYCWTSSWTENGWEYGADSDQFRRRKWRRMMEQRVYECKYHPAMELQETRQHGDHVTLNWNGGPLGITFTASEWMNGAPIVKRSETTARPGHMLTRVSNIPLDSMPFDSVMCILKSAKFPVALEFEKVTPQVLLKKKTKDMCCDIPIKSKLIGLNGYDVQGLPLSQILHFVQDTSNPITMQWHLPSYKSRLGERTARRLGAAAAAASILLAASV